MIRNPIILISDQSLTPSDPTLLLFRYKDQGTTMRAMPFPEYISNVNRDKLNVFYSVCQIFATSQVLFSYHLDEVFAGIVHYSTFSSVEYSTFMPESVPGMVTS